jgi:hypothetical protein
MLAIELVQSQISIPVPPCAAGYQSCSFGWGWLYHFGFDLEWDQKNSYGNGILQPGTTWHMHRR